jgi:hypothetical protein
LNTRERLEKEDGEICKMRRLIHYNFLYIYNNVSVTQNKNVIN